MDELEAWVDEQREQGFSDETLRSTLLDHGYDAEEADAVLGRDAVPSRYYVYGALVGACVLVLVGLYIMLPSGETGADGASGEPRLAANCSQFPSMLQRCTPYRCTFEHPLMGGSMQRSIRGLHEGSCLYEEEMPNNGSLVCTFNTSLRRAYATMHEQASETGSLQIRARSGVDDSSTTMEVNGSRVENVLETALTAGQCVIQGYQRGANS